VDKKIFVQNYKNNFWEKCKIVEKALDIIGYNYKMVTLFFINKRNKYKENKGLDI
jgi:hypothetical protein